MAWYKSGTITVTNGSTTVTGSGTQFITNVAIGEALYINDQLYEITNIASDTAFTILPAYLGSTAAAQDYVIVPSQSYIRDLAAQAADLVNNYSTIANFAGQGKFGDGTLTAPGIRYSDDLDTGFFRSDTNEVTFVAGGVAQFKYNASGISFVGGSGIDLTTFSIDGTTVTASGAELNILDGATISTAELNILDGVTSTATELNLLDGATVTTAEINILDGVTATASELNALDGITATTAELNYTDGVTSNIQTQLNTKAPSADPTFTGDLEYTGTLTGGTGVLNIGSGQVVKDASGNVGIGTTTSDSRATINGANFNVLNLTTANSNSSVRLHGEGTGGFGLILSSNNSVSFRTGASTTAFGTEQASIDSSGTLILNQGQIQFPATQVASSNANTLDDYEEGTFSPTFGRSITDPTVTYTAQAGHYVKIGRVVTVTIDMDASSISGGSGEAYIRGLPFLSTNLTRSFPVPTFRDCTVLENFGAEQMVNGFVATSANFIFTQRMRMGTSGHNSTGSTTYKTSGGRFCCSVTYLTST